MPILNLHEKKILNLVDDVDVANFNLDNERSKKMKLSDGNNVEIGFLKQNLNSLGRTDGSQGFRSTVAKGQTAQD